MNLYWLVHIYVAWGLILGTGLLWRLIRAPRCLHDWEPVVERELPSVAEVLGKEEVNSWRTSDNCYKAGRKKFFAIISCKKCGAVKEFETMSGEDL